MIHLQALIAKHYYWKNLRTFRKSIKEQKNIIKKVSTDDLSIHFSEKFEFTNRLWL